MDEEEEKEIPKYECPFKNCGRKFTSELKLKLHIERRHKNINLAPKEAETKQSAKEMTEEMKQKKKGEERTKKMKVTKKKEGKKDNVKKKNKENTHSSEEDYLAFYNERKEDEKVKIEYNAPCSGELTLEMVLEDSGCDDLNELEQLILRNKALTHFSSTSQVHLNQIGLNGPLSIQFITLSNNRLTQINDICLFKNLLQLNFNFNLIRDISPIEELTKLEKIWATNNQIRIIDPLQSCQKLNTISLFKNDIYNSEGAFMVFSKLKYLKSLDLDENPCMENAGFKQQLIAFLQLDSYGDEKIEELDIEMARTVCKNLNLGDPSRIQASQASIRIRTIPKSALKTEPPSLSKPPKDPGIKRKVSFEFGETEYENFEEKIRNLNSEIDNLKKQLNDLESIKAENLNLKEELRLQNSIKEENICLRRKLKSLNVDLPSLLPLSLKEHEKEKQQEAGEEEESKMYAKIKKERRENNKDSSNIEGQFGEHNKMEMLNTDVVVEDVVDDLMEMDVGGKDLSFSSSNAEEDDFIDNELDNMIKQNKKGLMELRTDIRKMAIQNVPLSVKIKKRTTKGEKVKKVEFDYSEDV